MPLIKFPKTDHDSILDYYNSHGYVVIEDLLNNTNIERFLRAYNKIKLSKTFIFFSQDTHLPLRPKLTPEGFLENSILNPASLKLWHSFSQSAEECLVDEGVSQILSVLSGSDSHVMMQNMFFDKSTGTVEHQDHYYLDSNPPGRMVAAWYSLEDIHIDAGCFFVLPGSHSGRVIERKSSSNFLDHDVFVKEIDTLIDEGGYQYQSFPLKKGDVLFWHPYTIHGAYNNRDPRFSRKSLTAHYYPGELKPLYSNRLPALRKTINPKISMLGSKKEAYVGNAMHYLRYISNSLRGRGPDYDMRRNSYS